MNYEKVPQIAQKWNKSERTIRDYCAKNRIPGAKLIGKTWFIPKNSKCPDRKQSGGYNKLLRVLKEQMSMKLKGGIYHRIQIDLTYNSNHMEGSRLTEEQTRHIFDTKTIFMNEIPLNVDDIIEASNHFKCIDFIIENASKKLTETIIKKLHFILKSSTSDSRKSWFNVGKYKSIPNEINGCETCDPEKVSMEMKELLGRYNLKNNKKLEDIIEFHYSFEKIHPFQDGNGRVGRLIMFKECLKNNIIPFIINDDLKLYYYRGLKEWKTQHGYLYETCLTAQDRFKEILKYFKI